MIKAYEAEYKMQIGITLDDHRQEIMDDYMNQQKQVNPNNTWKELDFKELFQAPSWL